MNTTVKRSLQDILIEKKLAALKRIEDQKKVEEENYSLPIPSIISTAIAMPMSSLMSSPLSSSINTAIVNPSPDKENKENETFSLSISLNKEQEMAKELAFAGKSFALTGAAGTGKTTTQREIARSLLLQNKLGTHDFRIQGTSGQRWTGPSVAFVAYTRIASGNLRRAIHKDPILEEAFLHCVTTIHNLLEYAPETYWDYEDNKEKFRFVPRRTANNPLDLTHLIVEESSMVGLDLWEQLFAALRPDTQIIFLGDINQLQPVFGASILNYALIQLPVIELTHVYRQAGDSTILTNAHHILKGESLEEADDFKIVRGGSQQFTQSKMAVALANTIQKWEEMGEYDPEQDIILSPFNVKDLGTDNMNKWVAQFLGKKRNAVVFHVIAGITQLYLAVGDKVLYNKRVGIIKEINRNVEYQGKQPREPSPHLTRFGTYVVTDKDENASEEEKEDDFLLGYGDIDLEKMIAEQEKEDLVRQASHCVTLSMEDDEEETLHAVGDFSPSTFTLGYCLTVHKAQGCEWRHVYIILHKDHSIMAHRELLYTAVTRASKKVVLIAKDFMIEKAIKTQKIKGNSLKDKIEFFNAKISLDKEVRCYK